MVCIERRQEWAGRKPRAREPENFHGALPLRKDVWRGYNPGKPSNTGIIFDLRSYRQVHYHCRQSKWSGQGWVMRWKRKSFPSSQWAPNRPTVGWSQVSHPEYHLMFSPQPFPSCLSTGGTKSIYAKKQFYIMSYFYKCGHKTECKCHS